MTAAARRSAAEQARLDNLLTSLFEQQIRFNQVLGLKLIQMHPPTLRFDMRPELIGHHLYGRLHGGVISATLDAMGGLALMWAIGEKHADETSQQVLHRFLRLGTIDLRVDYLRPGLGKHFVASAEVVRLGGRVGTTQMRLVNDEGMLISTATGAYVVS
ncbi:MAG TPA: thioesterase family protein [Burkholderiaceae bacterium]|nr:thioesterase family protein [Burkholderiaceae bacterium]